MPFLKPRAATKPSELLVAMGIELLLLVAVLGARASTLGSAPIFFGLASPMAENPTLAWRPYPVGSFTHVDVLPHLVAQEIWASGSIAFGPARLGWPYGANFSSFLPVFSWLDIGLSRYLMAFGGNPVFVNNVLFLIGSLGGVAAWFWLLRFRFGLNRGVSTALSVALLNLPGHWVKEGLTWNFTWLIPIAIVSLFDPTPKFKDSRETRLRYLLIGFVCTGIGLYSVFVLLAVLLYLNLFRLFLLFRTRRQQVFKSVSDALTRPYRVACLCCGLLVGTILQWTILILQHPTAVASFKTPSGRATLNRSYVVDLFAFPDFSILPFESLSLSALRDEVGEGFGGLGVLGIFMVAGVILAFGHARRSKLTLGRAAREEAGIRNLVLVGLGIMVFIESMGFGLLRLFEVLGYTVIRSPERLLSPSLTLVVVGLSLYASDIELGVSGKLWWKVGLSSLLILGLVLILPFGPFWNARQAEEQWAKDDGWFSSVDEAKVGPILVYPPDLFPEGPGHCSSMPYVGAIPFLKMEASKISSLLVLGSDEMSWQIAKVGLGWPESFRKAAAAGYGSILVHLPSVGGKYNFVRRLLDVSPGLSLMFSFSPSGEWMIIDSAGAAELEYRDETPRIYEITREPAQQLGLLLSGMVC